MTHPRPPTPSPQTPPTIAETATATGHRVPTCLPISTSQFLVIPIPSVNQSLPNLQMQAHHHQTGVQQARCSSHYGWRTRLRISVQAGSGFLRLRAVFIIRRKKGRENGSTQVVGIIRTIRIQGGTERGIGKEIERGNRRLRRKLVGGRKILPLRALGARRSVY